MRLVVNALAGMRLRTRRRDHPWPRVSGLVGDPSPRYALYVQWSKVKTRVKALMAPSLRKRIDFHMTQYRLHHNDQGDVCTCRDAYDLWVTIDQLEVFRASYCRYASESWVFELKTGLSPRDQGLDGELVRDFFNRREIHNPWNVTQSLVRYLDLNPHRALRSRDPIHKAFAIVDRRVGNRSLTALRIAPAEHSLVRLFYWLRLPEFSQSTRGRTPPSREF